MPIAEIAWSKLSWSVFIVSWITIPLYWVEVLILSLLTYLAIIWLDILTWFLAGRKKQKVRSCTFIEWLIKKMINFLMIWLFVMFSIWLNKVMGHSFIINIWSLEIDLIILIWLIPHFFLVLLWLWEFISLLENLSVIYWDKKEWKIYNTLRFLIRKLFNSSIDKIKEYSEKKIDDKFNK